MQSHNHSSSYKDNRWHLLFIRKNGRVAPIRYFKGLVATLTVIVTAMVVAIGILFFLFSKEIEYKKEVAGVLSARQNEVASLRKERDMLLARLAIAESKLKKAVVSTQHQQNDQIEPDLQVTKDAPLEPSKSTKSKTSDLTTVVNKKDEQTGKNTLSATKEVYPSEKVTADNLYICYALEEDLLKVEFKVINIGSKKQPVSGHAFIILKDQPDRQDQWIVLPLAKLLNGRPTQTRGQRFRIYNFRTLKFKVANENPGLFSFATIFIYRPTGELLFKRDFKIAAVQPCH